LPPTQPARPHPLTTGPSHLAPRTALWRHAANIFACHSGRASQASPGEGEPESSNHSGLGICAGRGLDTSHMPSVSRFFNPAMGTSNNSTFDTSCSPLRVMRVPGLDPGIDPRNHLLANKMDCRLESGNDDRDLIRAGSAVISIAQEQTFALHVVAAGRTGKLACHRQLLSSWLLARSSWRRLRFTSREEGRTAPANGSIPHPRAGRALLQKLKRVRARPFQGHWIR
jgi:hypothetical protein